MISLALAALAAFSLTALAACDGNAEKAGENADSTIENATQGEENLGDGPLEQQAKRSTKPAVSPTIMTPPTAIPAPILDRPELLRGTVFVAPR